MEVSRPYHKAYLYIRKASAGQSRTAHSRRVGQYGARAYLVDVLERESIAGRRRRIAGRDPAELDEGARDHGPPFALRKQFVCAACHLISPRGVSTGLCVANVSGDRGGGWGRRRGEEDRPGG
eukprot:3272745-Rhodomonas_salina.2